MTLSNRLCFVLLGAIYNAAVWTLDARAQDLAARAQAMFDDVGPAIVKLRVSGHRPNNEYHAEEGSGFFIYSDSKVSYILTALHVVGSNETEQQKNPDWAVFNGVIDRKISVSSLDDHGSLVERSSNANVAPILLPGSVDLALLQLPQGHYKSIHLPKNLTEKEDLKNVILLAFNKDKSELTKPIPLGTGQLVGFDYRTSVPTYYGESGGAWVDLDTGRVMGVVRGIAESESGSNFVSTPAVLIRPALEPFFVAANLNLDTSAGGHPSVLFAVLRSDGEARVAVSGSSGSLINNSSKLADLDQTAEIKGDGGETSQCDGGSGRTTSQASARGTVSKFDANGLRFEYALAAQGGHYRTAATCLGNLPIGLTGHDTSATADVALRGQLDFKLVREGTPVVINWVGMPPEGARVKVNGGSVADAKIDGSGQLVLKDLMTGVQYSLSTEINASLANSGSCCGQNDAKNATISVGVAPVTP